MNQENNKQTYLIPQANDVIPMILNEMTLATPKECIKTLPTGYPYVEIGYVKKRLNDMFTPILWSHTTQEIGTLEEWLKIGQITVKVTLTVKVPYKDNFIEVVKTGYGGTDIKKFKDFIEFWDNEVKIKKPNPKAGQIMDLGNDIKSAEADALKKAASNFNIAFDVYHGKTLKDFQAVKQRQMRTVPPATPTNAPTEQIMSESQYQKQKYLRGIFAIAKEVWGLEDKEAIKARIKDEFGLDIKSFAESGEEELKAAFTALQVVQQGLTQGN